MSIDLQTIMRENYAEISCKGTYNRDTFLDIIDSALNIGEDQGVATVVIDIRNLHLEAPRPGPCGRGGRGGGARSAPRGASSSNLS